jgi:acyl-CoA thioesterase-2
MADEAVPTPVELVDGLTRLLDLEQLDTDLFRGPRRPGGDGRVFGGQVIGQALVAAQRSTDPDRIAHSLHAYFMRAGDENHPIIYRVSRDHDGGSFSTRRIIAFQQGQPILNMAASFQRAEGGLSHQIAMPSVPDPESLTNETEERHAEIDKIPERFRALFLRPRPFIVRHSGAQNWMAEAKGEPEQRIWFKAAAPVGDDPALHRAMLAYASDMHLLGTATRPHGVNWLMGTLQTASLDHALWLHDDFRVDDWLLYATDSPWAGGGRGFNRGSIFSRDGRLVASVAQEGLIRRREPR